MISQTLGAQNIWEFIFVALGRDDLNDAQSVQNQEPEPDWTEHSRTHTISREFEVLGIPILVRLDCKIMYD